MARILTVLVAATLGATGCASVTVKQIGSVNMISTRNVDPKLNYASLATYAGGGNALKSSKALTLQDAVNNTVKTVPGGEFLMNAKVYVVTHGSEEEKFLAVEGDVWGQSDQGYRGFKVGDRVTFKNPSFFTTQKFLTGTVASLKTTEVALVRPEGPDEKLLESSYDDMTKAVAPPAQPPSSPPTK